MSLITFYTKLSNLVNKVELYSILQQEKYTLTKLADDTYILKFQSDKLVEYFEQYYKVFTAFGMHSYVFMDKEFSISIQNAMDSDWIISGDSLKGLSDFCKKYELDVDVTQLLISINTLEDRLATLKQCL
jgi:hypothetical protein